MRWSGAVRRQRCIRSGWQEPGTRGGVAIRAAAAYLSSWRLIDVNLYVTHEPCPMCAGAIVNARVPRVIYGADDPKAGAVRTLYTLLSDARLNHRPEVLSGVLADDCAAQLRSFFGAIRKKRT